MARQVTNFSDSTQDLYRKMAWNFYTYALDFGATGLNPPSLNDNRNTLLRKCVYYTAALYDFLPKP